MSNTAIKGYNLDAVIKGKVRGWVEVARLTKTMTGSTSSLLTFLGEGGTTFTLSKLSSSSCNHGISAFVSS